MGENGDQRSGFKVGAEASSTGLEFRGCWPIIAKQMMSVRAPGLQGILGNNHAAGALTNGLLLGSKVESVKRSAQPSVLIRSNSKFACSLYAAALGMGWPNGPCVRASWSRR